MERPAAQAGGAGAVEKALVAESRDSRGSDGISERRTRANRPPWTCCAPRSPCFALYDPMASDISPIANQSKAIKLMAQTATIVTTFDRLRNGKPVVAGDPTLGYRGQFPLHPHRQEARRSDGASLRYRPDPARRSRIERVHFRRARHGGNAFRYLFRGHRRPSAR